MADDWLKTNFCIIKSKMKNPHEVQQTKLLNRIVGSVGRLQKAMTQLNNQLEV